MEYKSLHKRIVSKSNIYSAIYSMESYVFQKELLSEEDIKRYYRLTDKFDDVEIEKTISECQVRLDEIINEDQYFSCKIYFKAKKLVDKKEVEFRPLHVSALIDLICMACLLVPLMFDDTSGKRKLSSLSRLLPANFYGNIPSIKVEEIFKNWSKQYKSYSDDAISAGNNYFNSKKYKNEVNLDLVKFFPSVDPEFIHEYVLSKWPVNTSEEDLLFLKVVLNKLLYVRIEIPRVLYSKYYGKILPSESDISFNIGIPQGLPQAYFFGNLCMAIIAKEISKEIDGDAFYYVDDSVIYTNTEESDINLTRLERNIEKQISSIRSSKNNEEQRISYFGNYKIKFHELGVKSSHSIITNGRSLYFLAKPASPLSFEINSSQDEYEDVSLLSKTVAILDVIIRLLGSEENKAQKKLLERYKKFYTNKRNYILLMQSSESYLNKKSMKEFYKTYQIKPNVSIRNTDFFDRLKDDVFEVEGVKVAQQLEGFDIEKQQFIKAVKDFEIRCIGGKNGAGVSYLYYTKVFESQAIISQFKNRRYEALGNDSLLNCINYKHRMKTKDKVSLIAHTAQYLKSNRNE